MQKYGHEGFNLYIYLFICLAYMEPKHQGNEYNQIGANEFQCLIWIF